MKKNIRFSLPLTKIKLGMETEEKREMEDMYSLNIIIEANREDEQPWRLNRIQRLVGYAQALADLEGQVVDEEFYRKIYLISDHKGELTVIWNVEPSEEEKNWLQKAWDSSVTGYDTEPIIHEVNN
jgi:hypothetical protein